MDNLLNTDYFKIKSNNYKPQKGKILISEPLSDDVFFKRSIVLLTEYSDDGAVGFILNKPINVKLSEAIEKFPFDDDFFSIGGPVEQDKIFFIHNIDEKILPGSMPIFENIKWGGDFFKLKELIISKIVDVKDVRFFLGYSGWTSGQLENEIKNHYWIVHNINKNLVFNTNDDIWREIIKELGDYKNWLNIPENPVLN